MMSTIGTRRHNLTSSAIELLRCRGPRRFQTVDHHRITNFERFVISNTFEILRFERH